MDVYQHYELLCFISLLDSSEIQFGVFNLHRIDSSLVQSFSHGNRFTFNRQTKEIKELKKDNFDVVEECCIYVENVAQYIHQLCIRNEQDNFGVLGDSAFMIVSKYFEAIFRKSFDTNNIHLSKTYFSVLVPTVWGEKMESLKYTMIQILLEAGATFQSDFSEKISILTELEMLFVDKQLAPRNKPIPACLKGENRCLLFKVYIDDDTLQLNSVLFQFKEEYDLRISGKPYCSPKILELFDNKCFFNWSSITTILKQSILQDLLGLGTTFDTIVLENDYSQLERADETLLGIVLSNTKMYLEDPINFKYTDEFSDNAYSPVEKYFTDAQLTYMTSNEFFKTVASILEKTFFTQISEIIDYTKVLQAKVPYFRIFCILNTRHYYGGGHLRYCYQIFCDLLQKKIECQPAPNFSYWYYNNVDPSIFDCFIKIARKVMVSTMNLKPVVITRNTELNRICVPLHYPVEKAAKCIKTPGCIIYIDISFNSTCAYCEIVNEEGIVQQQFHILKNIEEKLSSFMSYFKCELGISVAANPKRHSFVATSVNDDSTSTIGKIKRIWNGFCRKNRSIDRTTAVYRIQLCFIRFFESLLHYICLELQDHSIDLENVGYVLCADKLLMNSIFIDSTTDLFLLIKESGVIDIKSNPRKLIVVDQGEKSVWSMYQKRQLASPSYYVHAHVSDNHVYLKLKQVINTTESNEGKPESSIISIKDSIVTMDNFYEQVADTLWCYIHLMDEEYKDDFIHGLDNTRNNLIAFKKQMKNFIAEELFQTRANDEAYEKKHTIRISDCGRLVISAKQIMDIAIIPVVKHAVSTIVSCLVDTNAFGFYDIAQLFITGGFLKTSEYSETYDYMIVSEMEKELKVQLREKTYKTKFEIDIYTSRQRYRSFVDNQGKKHFCYDVFLKGELRTVSSTTYFLTTRFDRRNLFYDIENALKIGHSNVIILRGEQLQEQRFQVKVIRGMEYHHFQNNDLHLEVYKLNEPCTMINTKDAQNSPQIYQKPTASLVIDPESLITIHLAPIHHLSCIRITIEIILLGSPEIYDHQSEYTFAERQTLKYF